MTRRPSFRRWPGVGTGSERAFLATLLPVPRNAFRGSVLHHRLPWVGSHLWPALAVTSGVSAGLVSASQCASCLCAARPGVFVFCEDRERLVTVRRRPVCRGGEMVSRRRILSRSRDDLNMEAYQEEEEDVWYKKEKLYSVSTRIGVSERRIFWLLQLINY